MRVTKQRWILFSALIILYIITLRFSLQCNGNCLELSRVEELLESYSVGGGPSPRNETTNKDNDSKLDRVGSSNISISLKRSNVNNRRNNSSLSCALCFFGLPRSYKTMVLNSIEQNILIPNARHHCDIFVHYFDQTEEYAGRFNRGGTIDSSEIFLLKAVARNVSHLYYYGGTSKEDAASKNPISVIIKGETDEQFWKKRQTQLDRYKSALNKNGEPLYFPWRAHNYTNTTLDNIVRQWHSIDAVFQLMQAHGEQNGIHYSQVGMFRNDAMYLSPIDIYRLDMKHSSDNLRNYTVVPSFGSHPINDRMIYGPLEPIKIWATKRFEMIEQRAEQAKDPGFEMQSERFLNALIFPAMEKLGYPTWINTDVCFIRTRASSIALLDDCVIGGVVRSFRHNRKKSVENIIGRKCATEITRQRRYIKC